MAACQTWHSMVMKTFKKLFFPWSDEVESDINPPESISADEYINFEPENG